MSLTSAETSQSRCKMSSSLCATVHDFLKECVARANQPAFFSIFGDNACKYVVEDGDEELSAAILSDWAEGIVEGRYFELRLNGAGLKLNCRMRRNTDGLELFMHVGGDQADFYRKFVDWANERLFQLGMCRSWHRPRTI